MEFCSWHVSQAEVVERGYNCNTSPRSTEASTLCHAPWFWSSGHDMLGWLRVPISSHVQTHPLHSCAAAASAQIYGTSRAGLSSQKAHRCSRRKWSELRLLKVETRPSQTRGHTRTLYGNLMKSRELCQRKLGETKKLQSDHGLQSSHHLNLRIPMSLQIHFLGLRQMHSLLPELPVHLVADLELQSCPHHDRDGPM